MQSTIFLRARVAYVAYAVYPSHQRKGYAREAVQAIVDYIKQQYGVDRFLAEMDTRNEPSYRLAESLGFKRVETRTHMERGHGLQAGEHLYELCV